MAAVPAAPELPQASDTPVELERSATNETGFVGVKLTASGKFQPTIYSVELKRQVGLGSFSTAEEAALVLARAKRDRQQPHVPKVTAPRGKVRPPAPTASLLLNSPLLVVHFRRVNGLHWKRKTCA